MRDVYSKAAFCIAATAAPSSEVGLFFDRDTMKLTPSVLAEATWSNPQEGSDWPIPGSYLFRHEPPNPIFAIDHAPLNQRAWVAQERFLSPRILHFTETILFWECHTSFTSEVDPSSFPEYTYSASRKTAPIDGLKTLINDARWFGFDAGPMKEVGIHRSTQLPTRKELY
jgi:hypothetical protein